MGRMGRIGKMVGEVEKMGGERRSGTEVRRKEGGVGDFVDILGWPW